MVQAEESYLANHSTGDLSIPKVARTPIWLRITPTTVWCWEVVIIEDYDWKESTQVISRRATTLSEKRAKFNLLDDLVNH